MKLVLIGGSPAHSKRGASLLAHLQLAAERRNINVARIELRSLPADEILSGSSDSQALRAAAAEIAAALGVVVATPVYKGAYTGLLKCFLDTLPVDRALRGKVVFPIATAAAPTHVLALDYALKPVLSSLGASIICSGMSTIDAQFDPGEDGTLNLKADVMSRYDAALAEFFDICTAMHEWSS